MTLLAQARNLADDLAALERRVMRLHASLDVHEFCPELQTDEYRVRLQRAGELCRRVSAAHYDACAIEQSLEYGQIRTNSQPNGSPVMNPPRSAAEGREAGNRDMEPKREGERLERSAGSGTAEAGRSDPAQPVRRFHDGVAERLVHHERDTFIRLVECDRHGPIAQGFTDAWYWPRFQRVSWFRTGTDPNRPPEDQPAEGWGEPYRGQS